MDYIAKNPNILKDIPALIRTIEKNEVSIRDLYEITETTLATTAETSSTAATILKIIPKETLLSLNSFIAANWQTILSTAGWVGTIGLAGYFAYRTCDKIGDCPQYSDPDRPGYAEWTVNTKGGTIYDKIHRDAKGDRKIEGFQEHHIISNKNKATKDHEIWQKAGMSPDDPENKIFLPTEEENHPSRTIHKGRHWQSVSDDQAEELTKMVNRGEKEGWTQEQYKNELKEFINKERQRLRSGDADLNSINRHNMNGDK